MISLLPESSESMLKSPHLWIFVWNWPALQILAPWGSLEHVSVIARTGVVPREDEAIDCARIRPHVDDCTNILCSLALLTFLMMRHPANLLEIRLTIAIRSLQPPAIVLQPGYVSSI